MSTRIGHAFPRPEGAGRAPWLVGLLLVVAACDTTVAPSANSSPTPGAFADRPGISLDQTWTAAGGQWTFTGSVDPQGAATTVVLEIGPGPQTLRQFDTQVPVVGQVTTTTPLSVTTSKIPDIDLICVRFTATNAAGKSSTPPLCFPHDLPTPQPPGAPTARIDLVAPGADGQWTVSVYIDPKNAPTKGVLAVGTGSASAPSFKTEVPLGDGIVLPATVQVSTGTPASQLVCLVVKVTNAVDTTQTPITCYPAAAPPS